MLELISLKISYKLQVFNFLIMSIIVWFYNFLTSRVEFFSVEMDNSSSELVDYFIKKAD